MSDRNSNRNFDELNEQQRSAQEAARSLSRPEARADFRARLKEQFVAGEIPETELSHLGVEDSNLRPETQRLGRLWLGWSGLAAAAVVAAVVIGFNNLPGPELVATNGVGTVTVAGKEFAATDNRGINHALHSGARVQVGEGATVDIVYPGSFLMRAGEGTDVVMPDRPGRWFRRTVEAPMTAGELSVRTGPEMAGGSLVVRTDEGRAIIYGTLVSVLRNDAVTCVCLYEGSTDILTGENNLGSVPPGQRWVLFRDGSDPQLLEIVPAHLDHMRGLDEACASIFDLPKTR